LIGREARRFVSRDDLEKWNKRYQDGAYAERSRPSPVLEDWVELISPGKALDVACGTGRNALYLAAKGFDVDAVDISDEALDRARTTGHRLGLRVNWLAQDLDEPLALECPYQLILVIRYVNLSLIRQLTAHLNPGGFLICEQHLVTGDDVIGPTNPAYRVRHGDLRSAAAGLRIHRLEEGLVRDPDGRTAALARLVAQRVLVE
jgi:SAM-dependent methyltransferase